MQLGAGTALIYRALVRDESGDVLTDTDVSSSKPKMVGLLWQPGVMMPVRSVWDPAGYTTDASGFLYWMNGNAGYWGTVDPGDVIGVSFWLDFDNDDVIGDGPEAESNVPGWGTPWAQWEFVVP